MPARTDLHVHFAGVLSPDELIELGLEHNASVDAATAKRLQIVNASYSGPALPLAGLDAKQLAKVKAGFELDPDKKSMFDTLDEAYANRAFITKNPAFFVPVLDKIAHSYEQQGVSYAELSYAGIISDPKLLKAVHENMPRIEAETGVRLRFLGAMWRHSDAEWNLDEADRLKGVLKSPYVVGIDVMGHEKNPIRELTEPLQNITRYAATNVPDCVIRVHAGENPYYSCDPAAMDDYNFSNSYESLKIPDDARKDETGAFIGPYGKDIQIRVGHGRYGLHPQTLELMKNTGAISELCLSSNLLLNHADNFQGPFNLYATNGIGFVLGTDGYGIYNTTIPKEYALAVKAGMTPEARRDLENTEDAVLAKDARRFQLKSEQWRQYEQECAAKGTNAFADLENTVFSTPDGKQRWTPEVGAAKKAATAAQHDKLLESLGGMGIHTDEGEINYLMQHRDVTLFSGASKSSWPNVPEDQQKNVVATMKAYIDQLDGRRDMVVTGGTDFGFEAVIHRLVEERNKELPEERRIPLVGALTLEANIKQIRAGTLSHAVVLRYGDDYAKSWMDQSPALMDMVSRTNTEVVMAGGGQVIRDMIIDAAGRGLIDDHKILLFGGVNGASGEKAREYPAAEFRNFDELMAQRATAKLSSVGATAPGPAAPAFTTAPRAAQG